MKVNEPVSTVQGVMSKPLVTIEVSRSAREAAQIMGQKNVGSIVVVSKGKPVGIVTERDMVQRVLARGLDTEKLRIGEIMSKSLITIGSKTPIIEAIRLMQRKKVRRLLIKDNGKPAGIVTQRDLLRALVFHVIVSFRPLLETG
ncbi:MAG: CBS domain-containing protein [Candidatus Bathyarchaeota archaeon]|nr:CBS domain-containing protein [Candidatus Bathyarchaeota archaeon]